MTKLCLLAAIGQNRELGKGNKLLWSIPDDLERFKRLTWGHPIIMGRKTFDSIGRALPGRENLVVTRNRDWQAEGVKVFYRLEAAIKEAKRLDPDQVFVIGGGEIYRQTIDQADCLYLTRVEAKFPSADVYFPPLDQFSSRQLLGTGKQGGYEYSYWLYRR